MHPKLKQLMAYVLLLISMKQITLVFLLYLLRFTEAANFCSVICGTSCTGNLNNQCGTSCQTDGAWTSSNPTCVAKSSWAYFDSTSDYKSGTLAVSGASYTGTCGNMNFFGFVYPSTTITVTSSTGITKPYYQMRIYVGIIAIDVACWGCGGSGPLWSSSSAFSVNFNDPQATETSATNPLVYKVKSNTRQGVCNINKYNEYWTRVSKLYSTYNTTNTSLSWDITVNETTNATALWGIREFVILIHTCNYACQTCYGASASQCYSCVMNSTNTYWQSNNTCNETCLSHFGYTSTPNICVYCDLHCTACYGSFDNCSACTTSGIWASYLSTTANANYPTCVNPCLTGQFANKTARTCDPCNATCATCLNSANYCTSCINGTYWTGWFCYNPCPNQYFLDPNGTNCTKCSPFCDTCSGAYNICTVCTLSGQFKAYLYNTTNLSGDCMRVCPTGYYAESYNGTGPNLCLACNSNCTSCTGNPTPCTQCIPGLYLLSGVCLDSCPNGTIASNSTGTGLCLNCDVVCVGLTINMYFANVASQQMYIDMQFSQDLNFTTFNYLTFQTITITSQNIQYTLDMFTVTYSFMSSSAYRIILEPKTYIFLYNATFTVTTETQPNVTDTSLTLMPFKSTNYLMTASLTWFLIKGPPFNSLQLGIMNSFSTLSTKTNNFLAKPFVQQFKKSGVFSLLFSGAQITSCSMLSNQIQSQNMYQGVRVWAVFVFFDAPKYEAISDQTKRFISPTVQDQIRYAQQIQSLEKPVETIEQQERSPARTLFSTDNMYWRFQRTGQTSFFIYDVYIPMFLIFLCWTAMVIAHFSKSQKWYSAYAPHIYSAVHKIHEISIMYVTMAAIVQFIYFQPTSTDRIISAIICVLFNVYFAIYELYIYYDMINYPLAEIGNKYYDYYVVRYGYFLKSVRYEEYDISEKWSPSHWFRPYNYHLLSYYKKFVMMISLPLFYSVVYAQMAILFVLQLMELIRFYKTWPFVSAKRNYYRLSLEIALLLFFLVNLIQINILQTIMSSDEAGLETSTKIFYSLGWAGFAFCFYFNISFVCINIYDLCVGLKVSNRYKMDEARKRYYFEKIRDYQKDNEASSKELVGRWVKLGNLNNKCYGQLPEINVRIELYEIRKVSNKYEVGIKKITTLKMKNKSKLRKANHTAAAGKIQRNLVLSPADNSRFYSIINEVYKLFQGPHVETIRLKTFMNIWQKDYEDNQDIPLDRNLMFQRVELISYDNEKTSKDLEALIEDFPISETIIENAV